MNSLRVAIAHSQAAWERTWPGNEVKPGSAAASV